MDQAIKIQEFQNQIQKVKNRIPPDIYENNLHYFKKFKLILRHCYSQFSAIQEFQLSRDEFTMHQQLQVRQEKLDRMHNLISYLREEAQKLSKYLTEIDPKYKEIFST